LHPFLLAQSYIHHPPLDCWLLLLLLLLLAVCCC
jgi:hypothetical protein